MNLKKGRGIQLVELRDGAGLGAGVPLIEHPAGGQKHRKFGAGALAQIFMRSGPESSAAAGRMENPAGVTPGQGFTARRIWPMLRAFGSEQFMAERALVVGPAGRR